MVIVGFVIILCLVVAASVCIAVTNAGKEQDNERH